MILVKRATIFVIVICAVSIFYWVVGSESAFLDVTQAMLLGIMRISSLCIVAIAGIGVILTAGFAFVRKRGHWAIGLLGYVIAASFGGAALVLSLTVLTLAHGLP
jgi:hypothetical protein